MGKVVTETVNVFAGNASFSSWWPADMHKADSIKRTDLILTSGDEV